MRRADREISDQTEILEIVRRCTTCRLAFADQPAPYILPLSYGYAVEEGVLRLYFHCAGEGKKLDLLRQNPRVGFEMDGGERLVDAPMACGFTMEYESVIGHGTLTVLEKDEDKRRALTLLMAHYAPDLDCVDQFDQRELDAVCTLRLDCELYTAKRHKT